MAHFNVSLNRTSTYSHRKNFVTYIEFHSTKENFTITYGLKAKNLQLRECAKLSFINNIYLQI